MRFFESLDEVIIRDDKRDAIEKIDAWLSDVVDRKVGTPHVFILTGEPEMGKSYLIKKVLPEIDWIFREAGLYDQTAFIKVTSDRFDFRSAGLSELFSHRAAFGEHQETASARLHALTTPLILAIDELGMEKHPITDLFAEGLCTLMDARAELYTLIISNLGGTAIKKHYEDEPRILSRIYSPATGIKLEGAPWRQTETMAETEKVIAGLRAEAAARKEAEDKKKAALKIAELEALKKTAAGEFDQAECPCRSCMFIEWYEQQSPRPTYAQIRTHKHWIAEHYPDAECPASIASDAAYFLNHGGAMTHAGGKRDPKKEYYSGYDQDLRDVRQHCANNPPCGKCGWSGNYICKKEDCAGRKFSEQGRLSDDGESIVLAKFAYVHAHRCGCFGSGAKMVDRQADFERRKEVG